MQAVLVYPCLEASHFSPTLLAGGAGGREIREFGLIRHEALFENPSQDLAEEPGRQVLDLGQAILGASSTFLFGGISGIGITSRLCRGRFQ